MAGRHVRNGKATGIRSRLAAAPCRTTRGVSANEGHASFSIGVRRQFCASASTLGNWIAGDANPVRAKLPSCTNPGRWSGDRPAAARRPLEFATRLGAKPVQPECERQLHVHVESRLNGKTRGLCSPAHSDRCPDAKRTGRFTYECPICIGHGPCPPSSVREDPGSPVSRTAGQCPR